MKLLNGFTNEMVGSEYGKYRLVGWDGIGCYFFIASSKNNISKMPFLEFKRKLVRKEKLP